jgi:hypothetical protein
MSSLRRVALLIPALLLAASGCNSLANFRLGQERIPQAGPKNPIVQVLAMWQPGEGPGIDNKTTRGFVGTLYFFTSKSPIAAKTNGTICVYLFDDQGEEEDQVKPIHQFVWETEDLAKLGQPGKLGESYMIFIPYTRPGFHKAQCSLRVTFTPDVGSQVNSEMAYVALPGRKSREGQESHQANAKKRNANPSGDGESASGLRPMGNSTGDLGQLPPSELQRRIESIDLSALRKPKESPTLSAAPLNERERARIIRELQQQGEEFAVADEESRPSLRKPVRRAVVLANHEQSDESLDDDMVFDDEERHVETLEYRPNQASRQNGPRRSASQERGRAIRRRVVSTSGDWPETDDE